MRLGLDAAWIAWRQGDLEAVRGWCDRARTRLPVEDEASPSLWTLELAAMEARVAAAEGDPSGLETLRVLAPRVEPSLRVLATLHRAEISLMLGNAEQAEALAGRGRTGARRRREAGARGGRRAPARTVGHRPPCGRLDPSPAVTNNPRPLTDDGRYRTYRGNILQRLGVQGSDPELAGAPDMPVWMHPIEFSQIRAVLHAVAPRG